MNAHWHFKFIEPLKIQPASPTHIPHVSKPPPLVHICPELNCAHHTGNLLWFTNSKKIIFCTPHTFWKDLIQNLTYKEKNILCPLNTCSLYHKLSTKFFKKIYTLCAVVFWSFSNNNKCPIQGDNTRSNRRPNIILPSPMVSGSRVTSRCNSIECLFSSLSKIVRPNLLKRVCEFELRIFPST